MPTPITANEEPAAEAIRNRLNFFSTTPSPGKDSDDDVVHAHGARVHL